VNIFFLFGAQALYWLADRALGPDEVHSMKYVRLKPEISIQKKEARQASLQDEVMMRSADYRTRIDRFSIDQAESSTNVRVLLRGGRGDRPKLERIPPIHHAATILVRYCPSRLNLFF
jgi:hypothetical protein